MQKFAKEFLDRPVAVNDLGWVVWNNPNYVLDLWGLANQKAREIRIFNPSPGWAGPLAAEKDISVAMIYDKWLGDAVGANWIKLGDLQMRLARGYIGDATVAFYATSPSEVPYAQAALLGWEKTLPEDVCFVRIGEESCRR